jgi:hypothetical protein
MGTREYKTASPASEYDKHSKCPISILKSARKIKKQFPKEKQNPRVSSWNPSMKKNP